jgi:hypothetical protein
VLRKWLDYAKDADGKVIRQPRMKVFSTCKDLIRTLPTLIHSEIRPENYEGEDHAVDALRYHLMTPIKAPETPETVISPEEAAIFAHADRQFREQRQ